MSLQVVSRRASGLKVLQGSAKSSEASTTQASVPEEGQTLKRKKIENSNENLRDHCTVKFHDLNQNWKESSISDDVEVCMKLLIGPRKC